MRELGDRADDRARSFAGHQALDEAAVDLQFVEREALQIAQRRIAGAEIVEGDADAERAQRMEQLQRRFAAFEEDRFGDLDLEPVGSEAAVGERAAGWFRCSAPRWNCTGETLTATRTCSGQPAACAQASRTTQAPIGTMSPVSSAIGMKSAGEILPARRMVPAQQRLERANAVVLEVEQRLVVELELIALDREAKVGFELTALLRALVEALLEKGVGAAPGFLGAVQRQVGIAQQGFAIAAVLGAMAMPMLVEGDELIAVDDNGWAIASRIRGPAGRSHRGLRRRAGGRRIVAAEPATKWPRAAFCTRWPASIRSASPAGWPSVSLITLNWSRSRQWSANRPPRLPSERNRCSSCCWNMRAVGQAGQHVIEGELGDALLTLGDLADHVVEAGREPGKLVAAAHPRPGPVRRPPAALRLRRAGPAAG